MINILVADDHPVLREGIKIMLEKDGEMTVLDEAENGEETLLKITQKHFNIVLLDLSMPGTSGIDLIRRIKKSRPRLPVLVLSRYPEDQFAIPVLKAGASGYISKKSATRVLIDAIKTVSEGKNFVSASTANILVSHLKGKGLAYLHDRLTERELEVMCKIASGQTLATIAEELHLSQATISSYKSRVMEKIGFKTETELIRYCLDNGLVD